MKVAPYHPKKGFSMSDRINPQRDNTAEEILQTEIIINQALIDILIAKQIISAEELVDSIRKVRREQNKKISDSNKIVSLK